LPTSTAGRCVSTSAAEHADGTLVASGQVTRAIVDAATFMARAA